MINVSLSERQRWWWRRGEWNEKKKTSPVQYITKWDRAFWPAIKSQTKSFLIYSIEILGIRWWLSVSFARISCLIRCDLKTTQPAKTTPQNSFSCIFALCCFVTITFVFIYLFVRLFFLLYCRSALRWILDANSFTLVTQSNRVGRVGVSFGFPLWNRKRSTANDETTTECAAN